jgi:hypothetical protein
MFFIVSTEERKLVIKIAKDLRTGRVVDVAKSRTLVTQNGVLLHPCPMDGNCALHAISDQLTFTNYPGRGFSVTHLRRRIQSLVSSVLESFTELQRRNLLQETGSARNIDEYIELMARDGAWLTLPAIIALSFDLNVQIEIYTVDPVSRVISHSTLNPAATHIIRVLYNGTNHYDSIRGGNLS